MATISASLAWSVPVEVDVLIANYRAYVRLLDTTNTLRLCQRFGQGEHVAINRLPVEILEHIRSFLMYDERAKQQELWGKRFKCWQGLCRPIDHMTDDGILELYHMTRGEDDMSDDEASDTGSGPKYMHPSALEELNRVLLDDHAVQGFEAEDEWLQQHNDVVHEWRQQTTNGSLFSAPLLLEHFGLEIFYTNDSSRGQWTVEQLQVDNVYQSTIAYLKLPTRVHASHHFPLARTDEYEEMTVDTDGGTAAPVETPPPLLEADLTKFKRAFMILDLRVPARIFSAPEGHTPAFETIHLHPREGDLSTDLRQPKLRMLLSCRTEGTE